MTRFRQMIAGHGAVLAGLMAVGVAVAAGGYVAASPLAAPPGSQPAGTKTGVASARYALPAPVIVQHPASPTRSQTATFAFRDAAWPYVTFHCHVDSRPAHNCTFDEKDNVGPDYQVLHRRQPDSRAVYTSLQPGRHCFEVQVSDDDGRPSPVARFCWRILGLPGAKKFTVGGNLSTPLYPSVSESLNMTFTNPNARPITIAAGGVGKANIDIAANKVGCAASNFAVTQALTVNVTIPAHQATPISLSALHIPSNDWPVITMLNTTMNQDACQGATLTLMYSGIEAHG
jgi:hypothetical protein